MDLDLLGQTEIPLRNDPKDLVADFRRRARAVLGSEYGDSVRANPFLRVQVKFAVKTRYGRSLRRQHTEFLTVILTVIFKSGIALRLCHGGGDGGGQ